jgi:uncharacterized protein with ParB-like and HNH nuclease domain
MPIEERRSTLQGIGWMRDMFRADLLDLDPPYQRRSVWNREYQKLFIDSILRNYPVPPIFINIEVRQDGTSIYHIIDGKQRLLSVLQFLADEFPISTETYSSPDFAGKYFSELDPAAQRSFYSYFLPVEMFTELSREEVNEIYERFNRNVQKLSKQELRHARFDGKFITLMEQLADEPIWEDLRMFGKADIRRMRDVEYVSVIFSLTMDGIQDGDDLDTYYAKYDEEILNAGEHLERYGLVKSMIVRLQDVIRQTRFRNRADFYSLWSALLEFTDDSDSIDYSQTAENLCEFGERISAVPKLKEPTEAGEDAAAYSQAVRAGTTKQPNRERRKQLLLEYIVQK